MIDRDLLEASIKPCSRSLHDHILFTNRHHYGDRSHEQVVAKFTGTVAGEYIDFDRLEALRVEALKAREETPRVVARHVTKEEALRSLCGDELYKIMFGGKE